MRDKQPRRHDFVGVDGTDGDDFLYFGDNHFGRHGHQGVKIARGAAINEVPFFVRLMRFNQRKVGGERLLEQKLTPVNNELLLAFFYHCADTGGGKHAA